MIQDARNVSVWDHPLRAPAMVDASDEGYIQRMNDDGAIVLVWRGAHPGYLAIHWGTAAFCTALGVLQLRRRA